MHSGRGCRDKRITDPEHMLRESGKSRAGAPTWRNPVSAQVTPGKDSRRVQWLWLCHWDSRWDSVDVLSFQAGKDTDKPGRCLQEARTSPLDIRSTEKQQRRHVEDRL